MAVSRAGTAFGDWEGAYRVLHQESKRSSDGAVNHGRNLGQFSLLLVTILVFLTGCGEEEAPGTTRLERGTVFLSIEETLDGEVTETNIAQILLSRALLQHGFHLASRDEARYLVMGSLLCTYFQDLKLHLNGVDQHLEHQWHANFECTLTDRGENLAKSDEPLVIDYSFPEPLMNGRTDPELAKRDIRRRSATIMAKNLTGGSELGQPEIIQLFDAWQDPFDPRTFNEILVELVAHGSAAVPYLLDALLDERVVKPGGHYPGLREFNREELKMYHLADFGLSEILLRGQGLELTSTKDRRQRVNLAWAWVWEDVQQIPAEYREAAEARKTSVPDRGY